MYLKLVWKTESSHVHCQMEELEKQCANLLGHKNQQQNCKLRSNRIFVLKLHNVFKKSDKKELLALTVKTRTVSLLWIQHYHRNTHEALSVTELHQTLIHTVGDKHHKAQ